MRISPYARAAHLRLGRRGENAAVKLLKSKDFSIIARNWKHGAGELDIVARDGAMLVFAEVKSRRARTQARPLENLSRAQIARIRFGARKFLEAAGLDRETFYRFDLVEVWLSRWSVKNIVHHENCYQRRSRLGR